MKIVHFNSDIVHVGQAEDAKYQEPRFPVVLAIPAAIGGIAGWYVARLAGLRWSVGPVWSEAGLAGGAMVGAVTAGALLGVGAFLAYDIKRSGGIR